MVTMKTAFPGLLFLVLTCGLAAAPLTFTFEEYQVDPATVSKGRDYPLELLDDLKPIVRQSVELSREGNGKAVAAINGSTVSVEVRAVRDKESHYTISVKHELVAARAGDIELRSSRGAETTVFLEIGDERVVGHSKTGTADRESAFVLVVKLSG